jgi:acyl carrier protein
MSRGIQTFSPAVGLQAMERIMDENLTQVMVLRADWRKFVEQFSTDGVPTIFSALAAESPHYASGPSRQKSPDLLTQIDGATAGEIRKILQNHIRQVVIQVLGLEPSFTIDLQQGLSDIGMDSLMSLELRNRLQASTGHSLPPTLAFDCPTVETLAEFLAEKLLASTPVQEKSSAQQTKRRSELATEVDRLSEEEAEALLMEELSMGKPRLSI